MAQTHRPKKLRRTADYETAMRILQRLAIRGEASFDQGELQYFEALSEFVREYEDSRGRMNLSRLTPMGKIKFLMEQQGMKPKDLGNVLGSNPAASMILSGKRQPSKSQIQKLAGYFKVEPGLFLG